MRHGDVLGHEVNDISLRHYRSKGILANLNDRLQLNIVKWSTGNYMMFDMADPNWNYEINERDCLELSRMFSEMAKEIRKNGL